MLDRFIHFLVPCCHLNHILPGCDAVLLLPGENAMAIGAVQEAQPAILHHKGSAIIGQPGSEGAESTAGRQQFINGSLLPETPQGAVCHLGQEEVILGRDFYKGYRLALRPRHPFDAADRAPDAKAVKAAVLFKAITG